MPKEKPQSTSDDQNPPEQPSSSELNISTHRIKKSLDPDLKAMLDAFEQRETEFMNQSLQDAVQRNPNISFEEIDKISGYAATLGMVIGALKHAQDVNAILIVTKEPSQGIPAAIGVAFLNNAGGVNDIFLGRAHDEKYAGVVAPATIAILHKALLTNGYTEYTTGTSVGSEKLLKKLTIPHQPVSGSDKVHVAIDPAHTKNLFTTLGLDYALNPFDTTYNISLTPQPPTQRP